MRYCFVFEKKKKSEEIRCGIVRTVNSIELLIYITNFTSTKICTHQTLVTLIHVSVRRRFRHQGACKVGYVKW